MNVDQKKRALGGNLAAQGALKLVTVDTVEQRVENIGRTVVFEKKGMT